MESGGRRRVVIVGASGFTNLGDDAILEAMLAELTNALPEAVFTVATGAPERARADERVSWISFDERAFEAAIDDADLLIVGGGGFVYDEDARLTREDYRAGRFTNFFPYYRAAEHAYEKGVPVFFYGIGVGPLVTPAGRTLTRDVLSRATAVTVRDAISLHELRALGVTVPTLALTADPAVRVPPPPRTWDERPAGRAVAFVVRVWLRFEGRWTSNAQELVDRYVAWLAAAADHVVERWDATPVFLAGQRLNDDDAELAARVVESMRHGERAVVRVDVAEWESFHAVIDSADALVSSRLHPLILAAIAGVAPVGISVRPKVRAFLSALDLGSLVLSPWTATPRLVEALDTVLADPAAVRQRAARGLEAQVRAAAENPAVAARLLAGAA